MDRYDSITAPEEEDTLWPEGWQEGADIFAEGKRDMELPADESVCETDCDPEETGEKDGAAPTTEQGRSDGDQGTAFGEGEKGGPDSHGAPTTELHGKQPNKLTFRARVDRRDVDVELDESELPAVYQKAQVTDRVQAKLARMGPKMERAEAMARDMGYGSLDAMMEAADAGSREKGQSPSDAEGHRDFRSEARELLAARPELRGKPIPDSVVRDCVGGKTLLTAYVEYEAGQRKAEADRLRRENEVLRQNAAAAARAPVGGTREGGAAATRGKDDFLRGFEDED